MKGLLLRSVSGIVYVAVIVAGLIANSVVFECFICILTLLAVQEFSRLANSGSERLATLFVDCLGALVGVMWFYIAGIGNPTSTLLGALFVAYIIARLVMQLYTREKRPLDNLAYSFMAQLYITLPLGLMALLYSTPGAGGRLLLAMFIMIWLNDTGAFCVGSLIGRHKMFPRVSPKKSWEGLFGGIAFAVASAFLFKWLVPSWVESLSLGQLLGMGAVVGVFSTWGDLVESLIKRTLGVKDSGTLIPGHGGILDRIDSLLLVLPAVYVYLLFIA